MLILQNLSKTYSKGQVKAVDNLNLQVNDGEIFGFLGPNGAGKSTTIKMMTGILQPDDGNILLNGVSIKQEPYVFKHNIGYVPDNHATYEKLTGIEYLNFMGSIYDVPADQLEQKAKSLAQKFGIINALNDQIKTYSHGMKQKITIMSALVHNPKVWILDEPLTGLDPNSIFQVKECMKNHAKKGNIVFFSSHIIDVVEKICDKIAIIKKGQIQCVKTIEEIESNESVLENEKQIHITENN